VETQPPSSLSREQFQQFLSSKGLKIAHQNIRGLVSNFHMLQEFVVSHPKIDIITLSETHLTKANWDTRCELDGYTFIHSYRDQGKGGGVAMFLKSNITFIRRTDLEKSLTESLLIEITVKNSKSFLVGCFYRPPET
jgi:exonuclease III